MFWEAEKYIDSTRMIMSESERLQASIDIYSHTDVKCQSTNAKSVEEEYKSN